MGILWCPTLKVLLPVISGGRGHLRKQGGPKATFEVSIAMAEGAREIVMR